MSERAKAIGAAVRAENGLFRAVEAIERSTGKNGLRYRGRLRGLSHPGAAEL